jgi:hypothetical protein
MLLRITREMPSAVSVKFLQHSTAQHSTAGSVPCSVRRVVLLSIAQL